MDFYHSFRQRLWLNLGLTIATFFSWKVSHHLRGASGKLRTSISAWSSSSTPPALSRSKKPTDIYSKAGSQVHRGVSLKTTHPKFHKHDQQHDIPKGEFHKKHHRTCSGGWGSWGSWGSWGFPTARGPPLVPPEHREAQPCDESVGVEKGLPILWLSRILHK